MNPPLEKSAPRFPELFRDEVFRLETRRLWLRWPMASDAAALEAVAAREALARDGTAWPEATAEAEPARWIEAARRGNAAGTRLDLALALKARPQELVGLIGLRPLARSQALSVGFLLDVEHQGQGLMTEAVRALVGTVFRYTAWKGICGASAIDNAAGRRVLEKAGFRCVKRRSPSREAARRFERRLGSRTRADCHALELRRADWVGVPRSTTSYRAEAPSAEVPCDCGA